MKKIIVILFLLIIFFTITACKSGEIFDPVLDVPTEISIIVTPEVTDNPTSEPTEIQTEVPTDILTEVPTLEPTAKPTSTEEPTPTSAPTPTLKHYGTGEETEYVVELDPNVEYWDYPVSDVGHVFFHNLVAYPELDLQINPNSSYQDWCNTTVEFVRFIESVYEKGYILVDANYLYEYKETDEGLKAYMKDTIKLPKGKKGLVISCDNCCYPEDEHGTGRVDKLVVHDGMLASLTIHDDGTEEYSYELEIFPILEQFCIKHPDFSFNGAKCMLACSGRYGILGYRTASKYAEQGYDVEAEREAAAVVVKYLKEHGFYFGCHSYYHIGLDSIGDKKFQQDIDLWNSEVKTLIGYTPFYIYPGGDLPKYNSYIHQTLLSEGFHVFYGTEMNENKINGYPEKGYYSVGNVYTGRFIFCGYTMINYTTKNGWFAKYCDVYYVYDNVGRYKKLYK